MTSPDPIRLLEDPQMAASLRGDLVHASTASVQGLDHGVGLVGLKAAIAAEAAAASTAATGGSLAKIAIAVALLGGGAAAVWGATRGDRDDVQVPTKAASVDPTPARGPAKAVAPDLDEPDLEERNADAIGERAVEPELEPVVAEDPIPEEEVAPVRPQRPRKMVKPEPTDPANAADRVLREARLVADAREALGSSPSKALSLVTAAAKEFPRGQLVEEREAIAIRALAKLGRTEAAQSRADRFLARFGSGPHAEAVRRAIGESAQ